MSMTNSETILRCPSLLFLVFIALLYSCNPEKKAASLSNTNEATTKTLLSPPQVTRLADLPDSLQPESVELSKMPPPLVIKIPTTRDGTYYMNAGQSGENQKTYLEPPAIISLPVAKNEKGVPALGPDGQPIILGDGGISDFTTFNTDNGLPIDGILSSCMDHLGNLWFGTSGGGVSRFDGKSFVNFDATHGLANDGIYAVKEDSRGNMWFGTYAGGVTCFNGKSFVTYTTSDGLANDIIWSIEEDRKGNLWFGTVGGGASRFEPDKRKFTNFSTKQGLPANEIWSIEEDHLGNIWMGSSEGLSRFDPMTEKFTHFTIANGLANNTVRAVIEDRSGHLWIGTEGGGVNRYNPDTGKFINYTMSDGLADNRLWCITEDSRGDIWMGTVDGGVTRYESATDRFTTYSTAHGLVDNYVWSITEDKSGSLWFCTIVGGVSRYDGQSFTSFTPAQGLTNYNVMSMMEDRSGQLWFGTYGGGLSRFEGSSFTNFTISQGLANNYVHAIKEDRSGLIWLGTWEGLSCYDPVKNIFTNFTTLQGMASNHVRSLEEDRSGNIWIGTEDGGISCYDPVKKVFTNFTTRQGLSHNFVTLIFQDSSDNLWFGTFGGGVSRYDGESFTNYSKAQGLPNNDVFSINEDSPGNIWIGTLGGLSLFKINQGTFTNFSTAQGLPNIAVMQLVVKKKGYIYAGTDVGICELTDSSGNWQVGRVFNNATGYPVKDVNMGSKVMLIDRQEHIWIGNGSKKTALVRFAPGKLQSKTHSSKTILQKVKLDETDVCWYDLLSPAPDSVTLAQQEMTTYGKYLTKQEREDFLNKFEGIRFDSILPYYPVPVNLVLPYRHNNISFEFVSTETSNYQSVRYQYKLEGYSRDWSPVTDKTTVEYGNIGEGKYTFILKAKNPEVTWSAPVKYAFRVLPPWWRTWWAYTLYALLFLTGLKIFTQWRERNLRKEKEKLEQTVEIRTAEVVAEKKKSDDLLLNILPSEVAEELKLNGRAEARQFDEVTVMFTDFKGFTQISEKLTPEQLVAEIDYCFKAFDNIITKYNIEKIKTIGDSYMCAGGMPVPNKSHATDIVNAALEIQQFILQHMEEQKSEHKDPFEVRIGIHTGPVVAGIVGVKKFAYDIWGDTVNTASRMESSGEAGTINISGSTYQLVKYEFDCIFRGKIAAKNKGEIEMYFVEGKKNNTP